MEYNEFDTYVNSYRNIQTKIKKINIEDKTPEIEKLERDIRTNELEIQRLDMYREGEYKDVRKFEEASRPFMEKIRQDEEEIEKLKEFNKSLEERRNEVKKLEEYRDNVKKSMKAQKDSKLEKLITEKAELEKNIKDVEEQYNNFIGKEKENPRAVKDHKYREFLENKIKELKSEPKLDSINNQIKSINQAYKEALLDFERINRGEQDKAYIRALDEENKRKNEEKAKTKIAEEKAQKEADYNKTWDEAIEENKRRDEEKAKKEAEYNKVWDEAIEENKRRDEEKTKTEREEEKDTKEAEYKKSLEKLLAGIKVARGGTEPKVVDDDTQELDDMEDKDENAENNIDEEDARKAAKGALWEFEHGETEKNEPRIETPSYRPKVGPFNNEENQPKIEIPPHIPKVELSNNEEKQANPVDNKEINNEDTSLKEDETKKTSEDSRYYIDNIYLDGYDNYIEIVYKKIDQNKRKKNILNLDEEFKSGKTILKSQELKNKCKRISGNSIKGLLLKRKLNPAILSVLDKEEDYYLEEYIKAINEKGYIPYEVAYHVEGLCEYMKNINFFDRRIIKRVAKHENKVEGFDIRGLKENPIKRLASGLRKIKGPKKFKSKKSYRGKSIVRKPVDLAKSISKKYDNFLDRIVVNNTDNRIERQANINNEEKKKANKEEIKEIEEIEEIEEIQ